MVFGPSKRRANSLYVMQDAARFFKVLSDEARLKMIWLLFNHEELCVCDIVAALGITQSKASRHLTALRHAGLASDRKDGLWSHYRLRPSEDEFVRQHLEVLRTNLASREDAGALLEKLHAWLQAKRRTVVCAKDCHCATAKTKTSRAGRARSPRAARSK
jgi:ArsR family transcriptional regulator, arsenate/arsenite/antimonite-responsive transcriptional repressor